MNSFSSSGGARKGGNSVVVEVEYELIEHVWGDEPPESNALKSHIYALRKAIEQVTEKPILHTISNIGYQLKGIDD